MEYIKNGNNLKIINHQHSLSFNLYEQVVNIEDRYYMIGTPLDNFSYYPSGEDSVIIFRYDQKKDMIIGMEDDFEICAEVMNIFQDIYN